MKDSNTNLAMALLNNFEIRDRKNASQFQIDR
jgi:hypothetical protein